MARPPSQRDIADHLGIGQKTVSRVFGGGIVSEETRQRVLDAAKNLGYRPNAGARAMRTGRTGSIVLLQSTRESASNLPNATLSGLIEGLAAGDANLVVARFDDERLLQPGNLPKALRELTGDGVIVNYDTDIPSGLPTILHAAGLPTVWLNSRRDFEAVRPDDHRAGTLAAQRLIEAGHRHLAWADLHLNWDSMRHYSRSDRRDGFCAAAKAAGVTVSDWSPADQLPGDQICAWYSERLTQANSATGIGCYCDLEFQALLRASSRLGLRVPEDRSLVGVQLSQPFVGVDADHAMWDLREMGLAAAAMMLGRLTTPTRPQSWVINTKLRRGKTVSEPPR
jgi:LacI family transcriptional regulator